MDGDTAWKRWFGKDFDGPLIAFGTEISYLPIRPKDQKRTHTFSLLRNYQASSLAIVNKLAVDGQETL